MPLDNVAVSSPRQQKSTAEVLSSFELTTLFHAAGTLNQVRKAIREDIKNPSHSELVLNTVNAHASHYEQLMVDLLEERLDASDTTFEQHDVQLNDGSIVTVAVAPLDSTKKTSIFEFLMRRLPYLQALARICDVPGLAEVVQANLGRQTTLANEVGKLKVLLQDAKKNPEKADIKAINTSIDGIKTSLNALKSTGMVPVQQITQGIQELSKMQMAMKAITPMPPKVAATLNNGTPIVVPAQRATTAPVAPARTGIAATVTARMAPAGAYAALNSINTRFNVSLGATTTPAASLAARNATAAATAAASVASVARTATLVAPVASGAAPVTASFTAPALTATAVAAATAANNNVAPVAPVASVATAATTVEAPRAEALQQAAPQAAAPASQQVEAPQQQQQVAAQQVEAKAPEAPQQQASQVEAKTEAKVEAREEQKLPLSVEPEKRLDTVVEAKTENKTETKFDSEIKPLETKQEIKLQEPAKEPVKEALPPIPEKTPDPADIGGPRDQPITDPLKQPIVEAKAPEKLGIPGLGEEKKPTVLDVTTTIGKSEIIFKDLFGDAKDKVKSLFGVNAGGCTNCTTKDCKNCPMSGNALGSHQNMSGQDFDKALANFNKSYSPAPR